ncbi:MAG TPA: hypothetical protein VNN79_16825 [Actinomycetota bacterium]|nr:hypothetical protein [Actinomycetota bacterium]
MIPTYASLVRRFGLTFRPDFPAYAYGEHPNAYHGTEVQVHDGVVRAAFAEYEAGMPSAPLDPYDAALAIWREDGLLGAGDPGPPAFRVAHEAYLARRVAPQTPRPSEVTFTSSPTGRPRIALQDLLVPVETYYRETRDAIKLGAAGGGAQALQDMDAARDRLVAWFAERGVDVIP